MKRRHRPLTAVVGRLCVLYLTACQPGCSPAPDPARVGMGSAARRQVPPPSSLSASAIAVVVGLHHRQCRRRASTESLRVIFFYHVTRQ